MITEMNVTLAALLAGAALLGGSAWMSHRPKPDTPQVRWTPWRFLVLLGAAIVFLAGVHALNLFGFHTGRST